MYFRRFPILYQHWRVDPRRGAERRVSTRKLMQDKKTLISPCSSQGYHMLANHPPPRAFGPYMDDVWTFRGPHLGNMVCNLVSCLLCGSIVRRPISLTTQSKTVSGSSRKVGHLCHLFCPTAQRRGRRGRLLQHCRIPRPKVLTSLIRCLPLGMNHRKVGPAAPSFYLDFRW